MHLLLLLFTFSFGREICNLRFFLASNIGLIVPFPISVGPERNAFPFAPGPGRADADSDVAAAAVGSQSEIEAAENRRPLEPTRSSHFAAAGNDSGAGERTQRQKIVAHQVVGSSGFAAGAHHPAGAAFYGR